MNNFSLRYWLCILMLSFFVFSCKVQELEKIKIKAHSSKFLVEKLKENEFQFETISAKASISIEDNKNKKKSFKSHLRIKKDSVIWISITALGLEAARVTITKDSVKFIDRIKKQYFVGDFNYINNYIGAELDYQMLEAILIGNSVNFHENDKIHGSIDRKKQVYFLSTEKKRRVNKTLLKEKEKIKKDAQAIWLTPQNYKIKQLLLSSPEKKQSLNCSYSEYKSILNQLIPEKIHFNLKSESNTTIGVDYAKISSGKPLSFPFKISSKYEQIQK